MTYLDFLLPQRVILPFPSWWLALKCFFVARPETRLFLTHLCSHLQTCKLTWEGDVRLGPGKPADIAHAVAYLASPQAGYITGQEIHVNGGMFMA